MYKVQKQKKKKTWTIGKHMIHSYTQNSSIINKKIMKFMIYSFPKCKLWLDPDQGKREWVIHLGKAC